MSEDKTIAVIGAGSWGTALAIALGRNGNRVRLWAHRVDHVAGMRQARSNQRYLPDVIFPAPLHVTAELDHALAGCSLVVVAVPSHAYVDILEAVAPLLQPDQGVAWATKGLDPASGEYLHQVTARTLAPGTVGAVISGPSFASEVARGLPTALTVASTDQPFAERVAGALHGSGLRAYTSDDVVGVEVGGAVKNVLAVAAGISDALGFGANARAALITRGLAEMVRLGIASGGSRETFMGLTGVGDLVLTCTDNQSRNRRFGLALGAGRSQRQAVVEIGQVVEAIGTVREVTRQRLRLRVEMPITEQVNAVVHHGRDPRLAVESLLARESRPESG